MTAKGKCDGMFTFYVCMYSLLIIDTLVEFYHCQIALCLAQRKQNIDIPMVKMVVDSLGTQLQVRTFDMGVSLYLGGIYVQHLEYKGKHSCIVQYILLHVINSTFEM